MDKYQKNIESLFAFIKEAPTAYQATEELGRILVESGFSSLKEGDCWNLDKGGKYYFTRNDSALAAFVVGTEGPENGYRLAGAHTDVPALKLKSRTRVSKPGGRGYGVEVYGGPIFSTWLDRDLSLAGSVMIKTGDSWKKYSVDLEVPVAVIPNLAIHFNRQMNDGIKYNPQEHLAVMTGCPESSEDPITEAIARKLNCPIDDVGEGDLYFYSTEPGSFIGEDKSIYSTGRIDNLSGCHAILNAILSVDKPVKTVGALFFDNEEVGSASLQGADSGFLIDFLNRITHLLGGNPETAVQARVNSFLISVDGVHGAHPNHADKHDLNYAPKLNGGPAVKVNANLRYATTAEGLTLFEELCRNRKIPVQRFAMRSDLPCGSTIGPISSKHSSVPTIDVGIPMLAMHSIRETGGVRDQLMMTEVLSDYFLNK